MPSGTMQRAVCAAPHVEDRYLNCGEARLRYRDQGAGPAVLFIHGWALDLDMWELQAAALAQRFRIVRFDRRGFGLSTGLPSLARDVEDASALCDHLKLKRVACVGMSQGARVALKLAAAAQKLIECLALDGPPNPHALPSASAEEEVPLTTYRRLLRTQGAAAVRREWAKHPMMQLRTADPRMRELLQKMLDRYPCVDLSESNAPRAAAATVAEQGLHLDAIGQPTLTLTGEFDLDSRQRAANELAQALPHAKRIVIPDAGHLPNLDNPAAYSAALDSFFTHHTSVDA